MKKAIIAVAAVIIIIVAVTGLRQISVGKNRTHDSADSDTDSSQSADSLENASDGDSSEDVPALDFVSGEAIALWDSVGEMPYYDESIAEEAAENMGLDMPSITPYVADDNETGRAVIICPGGGYQRFLEETERKDVADK